MTSTSPLTIQQGTTYAVGWPIQDSSGVAIDLTGWTARAQVRLYAASSTVLHEWSTALGNITLDNSQVTLRVSADESSAWDWDVAKYDVELTDTLGNVTRVAEGSVFVSQEVTRDTA